MGCPRYEDAHPTKNNTYAHSSNSKINIGNFYSMCYCNYLRQPWIFTGFPDSLVGKESACSAGDLGSIPGSGRSPGEGIGYPLQYSWASLRAQQVKNLPATWETWVRSLGWEDPLEKETATHSSILAWRIPGTEAPGRLQSMGHKEWDTTE